MLTPEDLAECQATHEEIMVDTVRLYRSGRADQQPFDPALGYEPSNWPAPYYDGMASVQARPVQTRGLKTADQPVAALGYAVKIPVSGPEVAVNDLAFVVSSQDPRNVGLWLMVQAGETNTFATARRVSCTRYEGPVPE